MYGGWFPLAIILFGNLRLELYPLALWEVHC